MSALSPEAEALVARLSQYYPPIEYPGWREWLEAIVAAARRDAVAPYAALASGEPVDEALYHTDPIYHAIVYRMQPIIDAIDPTPLLIDAYADEGD